jgi:hypothetical protein
VLRRINSDIATLLARPFAGQTRDPMSGFFALRRETFDSAQRLTPLGYKIGLELMCKCRVRHVTEVPIHFAERTRGGSIIWVDPIGVGEELSRMTGWPYFGDGARAGRRHISTICRPCGRGEKIDPVIICSTKSCGTGKNLQHRYHRNCMFPTSTGKDIEQRIGRTHRSEQYADEVEVDMLYGCLEDWTAQRKAEIRSDDAQEDLTAPRKLLLARHERTGYPTGDDAGLAWKRISRVEVKL